MRSQVNLSREDEAELAKAVVNINKMLQDVDAISPFMSPMMGYVGRYLIRLDKRTREQKSLIASLEEENLRLFREVSSLRHGESE
jgi:hypothetical protein